MATAGVRYDDAGYRIGVLTNRILCVVNPQGTSYRVAIDEQAHPLMCDCEGNRRRHTCKHEQMVIAALHNGIPTSSGGRLQIVPGQGLVETPGRDPWERIDPFDRLAMDKRER